MSHGKLSTQQAKVVRGIVQDRVVHDLGCGDCMLAQQLLDLGASRVVAVDIEIPPFGRLNDLRLDYRMQLFQQVDEDIDVMFLSWPNFIFDPSIVRHAALAKTVVYLGKNTDTTACGNPLFFHVLLRRKLLAYVPHRRNSLVCVSGPKLDTPDAFLRKKPRKPTGEEAAGILAYERFIPQANWAIPMSLLTRWRSMQKRLQREGKRKSCGPFVQTTLSFKDAEALVARKGKR